MDFGGSKVIPIVVVPPGADPGSLGRALGDGGLRTVEVTLRTPHALQAIALIARETDLVVGAGTVLTAEQVDRAVEAGATYILSPGLSAPVVRRCAELGVGVVPGVATATELMRAAELGVDLVKFFPAEQLGGPAAITALAGPFPGMRFLPTGGVTGETLPAYLALPQVVAAGMSWVAPSALIERGDWAEISRRARTVSGL